MNKKYMISIMVIIISLTFIPTSQCTSTEEIIPYADVEVSSWYSEIDENYGGSNYLHINEDYDTYLAFEFPDYDDITSVYLKIYIYSVLSTNYLRIYSCESFDEYTITYLNAPQITDQLVQNYMITESSEWYTIDLNNGVNITKEYSGKMMYILLKSESDNMFSNQMTSKEGSTSRCPYLYITRESTDYGFAINVIAPVITIVVIATVIYKLKENYDKQYQKNDHNEQNRSMNNDGFYKPS